jgi:hypothetical protein
MNIIKFDGQTMTYTIDTGEVVPVDAYKDFLLQKKQSGRVEKVIKKERKKRKYTRRKKI